MNEKIKNKIYFNHFKIKSKEAKSYRTLVYEVSLLIQELWFKTKKNKSKFNLS